MNLKTTLLTATALGAFASGALAQSAANPTPTIPGMVPGTRPGFVRPANDAQMTDNTLPTATTQNAMTQMPMPGMGAVAAQDQLFAARASEGNLAEITFATLALDKTRTPAVRQTAQIILAGHTKAQNDLLPILRAKGMTAPPKLGAAHMVVYDALRKARGDDFDKMYMAGQTTDHENTIALFGSQTKAGQDTELTAYANQYLPNIVGHTIVIYNVARQVQAPGSEVRPMLPPVPPGVTPALMGNPINMTDTATMNRDINQMIMDMNRTMPQR